MGGHVLVRLDGAAKRDDGGHAHECPEQRQQCRVKNVVSHESLLECWSHLQPSASSGAAAGVTQACDTATTIAALATAQVAMARVNMTERMVLASGSKRVSSVTADHPAAPAAVLQPRGATDRCREVRVHQTTAGRGDVRRAAASLSTRLRCGAARA